MSGQPYALATLPTGLGLQCLLNKGLVLSYSQSGRFWRKKRTLLCLLGCLAGSVVTVLTEIFRLPSAGRRKRIICSKYVTGVVFVYGCVGTKNSHQAVLFELTEVSVE